MPRLADGLMNRKLNGWTNRGSQPPRDVYFLTMIYSWLFVLSFIMIRHQFDFKTCLTKNFNLSRMDEKTDEGNDEQGAADHEGERVPAAVRIQLGQLRTGQ